MGERRGFRNFITYLNVRLAVLVLHCEREVLEVMLHGGIRPLSPNETLGIKHCVLWVAGQLVLGSITNQPLSLGSEGHVRWRDTVSLVVSDDLHTPILENSDAKGEIIRGGQAVSGLYYPFFFNFEEINAGTEGCGLLIKIFCKIASKFRFGKCI